MGRVILTQEDIKRLAYYEGKTLPEIVLNYRINRGESAAYYRYLYNSIGRDIGAYSRRIYNGLDEMDIIPVTETPPPDLSIDMRDSYYLYREWLKRRYGEWYRTSVERIVEMAKRLRDLEPGELPE